MSNSEKKVKSTHKLFQLLTSIWKTVFIEKKMPWKLQRIITLLKINSLRSITTTIRFLIKKPKYRIVVSSIYFGGVGGSEKDLLSLVESMHDSIFYIYSENINSEGFVPKTNNFYLNIPSFFNTKFDLYYYFAGGGYAPYLGNKYLCKVKIINTNARNINDEEKNFDHIIHQCDDFARFFKQHHKHIYTFPDVKATFPKKRIKVNLPKRCYFTVFNPFSGKQKGYELFLNAADHSKFPIVWCFNNKTKVQQDTLPDHPNIIKMPNLSQEELFYIYEHANAFISFSSYESFGWALAEAFFCNIPIVSKKTGFMEYVKEQPGIHLYTNNESLFEILENKELTRPKYNPALFYENSYRKVIEQLIDVTHKYE